MFCRTARQLYALARMLAILKSEHKIYNSFVTNNFNYCPLVWHLCGQVNNNKLKKWQERSIIYNDYGSSFETLLRCSNKESLLTKKIKNHDFRSFNNCQQIESQMYPLFVYKIEGAYEMRNQKLEQPKRRTTTASNISVFGIKITGRACQSI